MNVFEKLFGGAYRAEMMETCVSSQVKEPNAEQPGERLLPAALRAPGWLWREEGGRARGLCSFALLLPQLGGFGFHQLPAALWGGNLGSTSLPCSSAALPEVDSLG